MPSRLVPLRKQKLQVECDSKAPARFVSSRFVCSKYVPLRFAPLRSGRQSPQWMADLLIARRRALGAPTFSPAGLYLAGVDYDPAMGLPGGSHDPLDPPGILPDVSEGAVA